MYGTHPYMNTARGCLSSSTGHRRGAFVFAFFFWQRVVQSAGDLAVGIIFGFWLGCALGEHDFASTVLPSYILISAQSTEPHIV